MPFVVYNASAGSGKTFALVCSFLQKMLETPQADRYKKLLAITFTNKAVAEMKTRILSLLQEFAKGHYTKSNASMAQALQDATGLSAEQLTRRSTDVLKHLLNHYALFHVETIDRFNHRLLRTFARDLKLSSNFDVSLEAPLLLSEAVDQLIDKAGTDREITDLLIDFALQKTEDNKSWDISFDLNKVAELLIQENDQPYLKTIQEKPISDYLALEKDFRKQQKIFRARIEQYAVNTLKTCHDHELGQAEFKSGYFFKFLLTAKNAPELLKFNTVWQAKFRQEDLYTKTAPASTKECIDRLMPVFVTAYEGIKQAFIQDHFARNVIKNLIPLATLASISREFEAVKTAQNTVVVSDFNRLLAAEIKDQPAPFIYERLGERYRHFFIDEFQDTSAMQWNNLLPLVGDTLSQSDPDTQAGTIMLVGDPKQSIYRWRGGHPEQFMALARGEGDLPHIAKATETLDTNYRSKADIVVFNNAFFSFAADILIDPAHQTLYQKGSQQKNNQQQQGYVQIDFLDMADQESESACYQDAILQQIKDIEARQVALEDVCILTRNNKQCSMLGAYLSAHGFAVVSEEALLIKHDPVVSALLHVAALSISYDDVMARVELARYLHDTQGVSEALFDYLQQYRDATPRVFEQQLNVLGIDFSLETLSTLGLYERFEYAIKQFGWAPKADGFVTAFMDWVFQFSKRPQASIWSLMAYWEQQKERLSLSSSKGLGAITLMTIHKAKGLEFPVVIFPFADMAFSDTKARKVWYPHREHELDYLRLNYDKDHMKLYGTEGEQIHQEKKATEVFDTLNLLYVALTRAENELYIFCKKPSETGQALTANKIFWQFLEAKNLWSDSQLRYHFGALALEASEHIATEDTSDLDGAFTYQVILPESHPISFVGAQRRPELWSPAADGFGSLFHEFMALIKTPEDQAEALHKITTHYYLDKDLAEALEASVQSVLLDPQLSALFDGTDRVHCEQSIITPEGVLRPDRINYHQDGSYSLIDYKTGAPKPQDEAQISQYAQALTAMGFSLRQKLLVYLKDSPIVVKNL